jgi:hypothetical protein
MADILSSISVLLVFLTFLLNGIEKDVREIINKGKPPKAQSIARAKFNSQILRLLLIKTLPVTLGFTMTFYTLLPKTIYLFTTTCFSLWQFDELNTLFVFIEIGLLALTIFACYKSYELIKIYFQP